MIYIGSEVGWRWGNGIATGIVLEIHPNRWEIFTKGKLVVRNGTLDDPAIVIQHSGGSLVLKLAHELQELGRS